MLPSQQLLGDEAMRPVPRFSGASLKDSRTATQRASTPGLQWRTSSQVAGAQPPANASAQSAAAPSASMTSENKPSAQSVVAQSPASMPQPPVVTEPQTTLRIVSTQQNALTSQAHAGANQTHAGANQAHAGANQAHAGANQAHAGANQARAGASAIPTSVQQVRYQNVRSDDQIQLAQADGGFTLPPGLTPKPADTPAPVTPLPTIPAPALPKSSAPQAAPALPDYFNNPFGDDSDQPQADLVPGEEPSVAPEPSNGLRAPSPQSNAPLLQPQAVEPTVDEMDETIDGAAEESEMGEVLPPDSESPAPNPFDRARQQQAEDAPRSPRNLEDFDFTVPRSRNEDGAVGMDEPSTAPNDEIRRSFAFSCDEFRKSIAEATIQKVSLDISPPFRPDVIELDEYEKLKNKFDESQEVREWYSIDGRKLGRGRLVDLAYEKVVIETEFGTQEELPINRVSEADLAYLSKNWGLPQECLIEQVAYVPRNWQASTITWKASNLCHKPLYFEEVNLERYGHTAGPFAQPIVSSAHFFVNIAVLPYKMGVHAPNECQYTLGYYRPGDCAPWIVPPVPISLRGGLYQAAAMTGAFWLIP